MSVLPTCVSVNHVSAQGQKRASDPPELESQVVVSHRMSTGNRIPVLCKNSQCSSPTPELTLWTRLALNSQRSLPPKCWD